MSKKISIILTLFLIVLVVTLLPVYTFSGRVFIDSLSGPSLGWYALHTYFVTSIEENIDIISVYPQNVSLGITGLVVNFILFAILTLGIYGLVQNYKKITVKLGTIIWPLFKKSQHTKIFMIVGKIVCAIVLGFLPIFSVYNEYETSLDFSELNRVYWKYFFQSFYGAFSENLFYFSDIKNVLQLQALIVNILMLYIASTIVYDIVRIVLSRLLTRRKL
jgi:hypothetical protein